MNDQNEISTIELKYKRRLMLLSKFHSSINVIDVKRTSKYRRITIVYCLEVLKDYDMKHELRQ